MPRLRSAAKIECAGDVLNKVARVPLRRNSNLPQCAPGQAAGCNNYLPYTVSLSGEANPYSPTFQANLSVSYALALGGGNTLTPRIDYSYTGTQYASIFQNTDFYLLSARSLLDVYLSYDYKTWQIQAFMRNATNQTYIAGIGGATGTAGAARLCCFRHHTAPSQAQRHRKNSAGGGQCSSGLPTWRLSTPSWSAPSRVAAKSTAHGASLG